ncbi:MAG: ParB/RepB/Spo0J family partition protein [Alphaproteobacteria bacterium]
MSGDAKTGRPKLGRGLAALLGDEGGDGAAMESGTARLARAIPISALEPGSGQPRRYFDEDALDALAQSIRERGMLQPIIARRIEGSPGRYEIVAGERRWRAAGRAGLAEAPVILRDMTDRDALEIALIENVQREDLNPVEEAAGYQNLVDAYNYTQEDLAKAVGKSRPHVANMLRLLNLPEATRARLAKGELSAGHARALLVAADPDRLADQVIARGLNVRQTERLVQEGGLPRAAPPKPADPNLAAVERDLSDSLGLKVVLKPRGKRGGRLVLDYKNFDQLDLVVARLTGRPRIAAIDHDDPLAPSD